jgi:glycolate oxidase
MFTPVNSELLARLEAIVGPANVLTDRDAIEKYSHDETPGVVGWPEVVVKPANRDEIVAIMHLASANTVAVTPRGAGQGL